MSSEMIGKRVRLYTVAHYFHVAHRTGIRRLFRQMIYSLKRHINQLLFATSVTFYYVLAIAQAHMMLN